MIMEVVSDDVVCISGAQIEIFRLMCLRTGLESEVRFGVKLAKGRSAYSVIKSEFKLKGNKQKVLDDFTKIVDQAKRLVGRDR
jgi:hypothetical protein